MSKEIVPSRKIHSIKDAINLSRKRLPKLVFDFIDGASGDDKLAEINSAALDQIRLEPKVFRNVEQRILNKKFLDKDFNYPFGFAPMGMTNLSWPEADKMFAEESALNNIPTCVSMASSTTLEDMHKFSEGRAWMQIYIFQSEEFIIELLERAKNIGYETLILTVDVPILSRRSRDDRNGFGYPFKIGPRQLIDFAFHPQWSLTTLLKGAPKPMNYVTSKSGNQIFRRKESRGTTDWDTLKRIRDNWKDKLIIKGIMNADDAIKIKAAGADGIQVSNHGGRQLDSATAAINALPNIRKNLGDEFPIIFDSGIRSGSDILRALALGADFVMLGRPLMYAVGADGARGLRRLINIIKEELSTNLGLVGLTDINNVDEKIIADKYLKDIRY